MTTDQRGVDLQTDLDFGGIMPDDGPDFDAVIVHSPNGNGQHAPGSLLETAQGYSTVCLSVLPVSLDPAPDKVQYLKRPIGYLLPKDAADNYTWEPFQREIADDETIHGWFAKPSKHMGIGIVTGEVSGGLECIDIDDGTILDRFKAVVNRNAAGLFDQLLIERTRGGGYHVVYRCAEIDGNQELAKTPRSLPGHKPDANGNTTMIETRGEGGFLVIAPSAGYALIQGDWRDIQSINAAQRDLLLSCARMLDETGQAALLPTATHSDTLPMRGAIYDKLTPEHRILYDTLTPAGWALVEVKDGVGFWKRPGTDAHHSATWNFVEGRFKVFSTNGAPFETNKLYTLSEVQALFEPGNPAARNGQAWRLYSMIDARAPREPLRFIVEALIVGASLIILYGAPGTLKSMLLADLAVCVAAGLAWLSSLPGEGGSARRVTQGSVLWCDFDNGTRRTHERFEALGRAYSVPDDIPLYYVSMPSPWLDASAHESVVSLADRVKDIGAALVVIDNLGTVTGKADENSAEMINVMAHLRWLAEFTGAAVVLIHHQRKGNGLVGRAGETLRGHSSIEAALDLALLVEREPGASMVSVKSTKTRDVDVPTFGAQFSFEHRDGSKELQAARFFGVPMEDTTSDQAIERAILEAVTAHHPINQTKLANAVKDVLPEIGTNRIKQLANRLITKKRLTATSGAHGARLYDLSDLHGTPIDLKDEATG